MDVFDFIDSLNDRMDFSLPPERFLETFDRLPQPHQHLYASHWCDAEVCNGGFDQFFLNSTGLLAPESAIAFRAIGFPDAAELVEIAIDRFGPVYPRDHNARIDIFDEIELTDTKAYGGIGMRFSDLDNEYYKVQSRYFGILQAYWTRQQA